jgi:hypothetical protein
LRDAPEGYGTVGHFAEYVAALLCGSVCAEPAVGVGLVGIAEQESDEPSMNAALKGPNAGKWLEAIWAEYLSLIENGTWELVDPPGSAPVLPCHWILKVKRDALGNIERYKARLVVQGNKQTAGVDYNEVFAPTGKAVTLRAFLATVAAQDLELHSVDVTTAFLNGSLQETVYMHQPHMFREPGRYQVCKLVKSLYGLKQAPREWHKVLKSALLGMGFSESHADGGFFFKRTSMGLVLLHTHVDDLLIAAKTLAELDAVKAAVQQVFKARDQGEPVQFVAIKIDRDRAARSITLSQPRLAQEILELASMDRANGVKTPLDPGTKLVKEGELLVDARKTVYAVLVGKLMYLAVNTRPDLAHAVSTFTKYMSCPTGLHWAALKHVLRYLAGTRNQGITYGCGSAIPDGVDAFHDADLAAFCDADWGGDVDSRRSTTGYVFTLFGGAISWQSKLQPTVATSTVEAEYIACAAVVKEALWLRTLLHDLGCPVATVAIGCDNQGTLDRILNNNAVSQRTKHIDVQYHFTRQHVQNKEVAFHYVRSSENVADCFTKPVTAPILNYCKKGMGMPKV